jgi:hypothetical protein
MKQRVIRQAGLLTRRLSFALFAKSSAYFAVKLARRRQTAKIAKVDAKCRKDIRLNIQAAQVLAEGAGCDFRTTRLIIFTLEFAAGVAKLVYAPDSKSGEVTLMSVRVRPPAP